MFEMWKLSNAFFIDCRRGPDRLEVGTFSTLHLASNTLLYAYTVEFKYRKRAKEVHPSGSAIQAEKKGTSSVALQVPFWATWGFRDSGTRHFAKCPYMSIQQLRFACQ